MVLYPLLGIVVAAWKTGRYGHSGETGNRRDMRELGVHELADVIGGRSQGMAYCDKQDQFCMTLQGSRSPPKSFVCHLSSMTCTLFRHTMSHSE